MSDRRPPRTPEEELDRELVRGGFDLARVEAKAREDAARARRAQRRRGIPPVWYGLALAAIVLLAVGLVWRGLPLGGDIIVAKRPDATDEPDAEEDRDAEPTDAAAKPTGLDASGVGPHAR
jgi:hypothetical protein